MTEIHQCVSWALEQSCPVRKGEDWQSPLEALRQTLPLRRVTHARYRDDLIDGVYLVSASLKYEQGAFVEIPRKVCRVDDLLKSHGGLEAVRQACGQCSAHTTRDLNAEMAGCCGRMVVSPDSVELDEALRKAIVDTDTYQAWKKCFKNTTPCWFGFWMKSPLTGPQCEILRRLFTEVFLKQGRQGRGVKRFETALRMSLSTGLPLHVTIAPPGRSEAGFHTVFPHCPECKAEMDVRPARHDKYLPEAVACPVCHHSYFPTEMHQIELEARTVNSAAGAIEEVLDAEETRRFVRGWMTGRGFTEQEVQRVLARRGLVAESLAE